jgi:peptide/nickel transport system permease protein
VASFILSRLASALVAVLGVSLLVFMLIHLIPGDPVEAMLGESSRPADRAELRHALGLDRPLATQMADYYRRLARFDLGQSLYSRRPVADMLAERIPATASLAAAGLLVGMLIAFPLGILAAARRDSGWDAGAMAFSMFGLSIPNFLLGPLLILLFALWLGWLPVSGREGPASLVLPALTLGTALAAVLARMVRATLLETFGENYVLTARAKGLSRTRALFRHALPNALLPVMTLLGLQLGALLAGAVITEIVFSWPGVGQLTVESIQRRDYAVVQACILLISLSYVAVNTVTDLAYAWLDPRVRLRGSGG